MGDRLKLIGIGRHRIVVDGSGVTTLVAFHGCPQSCKFCLNPQSLSSDGIWKCLTIEELFDLVKKDDLYFRATRGGVTFGGGEPLLAYKQIRRFKELCFERDKNWRINVETSLNVPKENVKGVSDFVNHWIVDIKDMNPAIYNAYTGKDNTQVLQNLQYLIDHKAEVTVRVPLISEFNTEEDVERSIEVLQRMGITDIDRFTYITKRH
jgi:pyruvate formate lyase activating enzyme